MRKFHRRRGTITTRMSGYEVELLSSLVMQLVELVSDGDPSLLRQPNETVDPFEELARDFADSAPDISDDPVLRRLFPDAYSDGDAAADFRRYTERSLKTTKVAEAQVVLHRLAETELGQHDLKIPPSEADAWLRTLTSVRLAVATRLGITDAAVAEELSDLPEDDPRGFMVSVYDWLGFAQETLISAL